MSGLVERVAKKMCADKGFDPEEVLALETGKVQAWVLVKDEAFSAIMAVAEWLKAEDQAETSEARRMIFKELEAR